MKEVMELIKNAGLMKNVVALPQCFEGLVKEFVVNIPEDISDKSVATRKTTGGKTQSRHRRYSSYDGKGAHD